MNPSLTMLLTAVLAIAGNAVLTKNANTARQELLTKQQAADAELERTRSQAARLPQLRRDIVTARKALVDLKNRFPAQENLGVLLDDLEMAAARSGLKVSAVNRTVKPSPIPGFNQVDLDVLADGDYPSAVTFLNTARDAERLLNVTEFKSLSGQQTLKVTGYVRQPLPGETK